ncbi:repetitive proline-rich cell wall protein 1-like [Vicia villosa]|uniref:repetitive proline-rich cell wall protein 1-like n=1 Tax=Vicia villosa TaxID=3911 RepID=UPI00273B87D4|nr:repetitive proline-rich cell wall protein 1-like [Vicia villosa]
MRKAFCVPLLLLVTLFYATSVVARNDPSGNEVNTEVKHANEEVTKPSLKGPNEDEKFKGLFHLKHKLKGYFHKKPIYYKPIPKYIPTYKPFHKPIIGEKPIPSVVEPEAFLKHKHYFFKKPIVPIVKPVYVPIYKPVPKVIPIYKPIPKVIPIYKPIPKVIPIVKPIH